MKVGDLVWYNTGGSQQTGIVLEVCSKIGIRVIGKQTEMIKIHWNIGGTGPLPAMYTHEGTRLWGTDRLTAYVPVKGTSGIKMFKVISKA